jgi:hypothetical protein
MRAGLLIIVIKILFISIAEAQLRKIEMTGRVEKDIAGSISLRYDIYPNDVRVLSAPVKDGVFSFQLDIVHPVAAVLSASSINTGAYLYLDTANIDIKLGVDSSVYEGKSYTKLLIKEISGSPTYHLYKDVEKRWVNIDTSGMEPD